MRDDERVDGRLAQLEAVFRASGFGFTGQDRGQLRDYLRNNDGRSRYEHLMDLNASPVARAAAAFDRESRRSLDDPMAPASLAESHRRLFQHADPRAGQLTGQQLPQRAYEAGENLRNLSSPGQFARSAAEYYTAVSAAAPHGRGSEVAALLFVDRQARAAGHRPDWRGFQQMRNSAEPVLTTRTPASQTSRNERAFSAAILLRQFGSPGQRPGQQPSRTPTRRQGALGQLRRGLGLDRRERPGREARGGQRSR